MAQSATSRGTWTAYSASPRVYRRVTAPPPTPKPDQRKPTSRTSSHQALPIIQITDAMVHTPPSHSGTSPKAITVSGRPINRITVSGLGHQTARADGVIGEQLVERPAELFGPGGGAPPPAAPPFPAHSPLP